MSIHIQKCHIYKEQHTFYFRNGCLCTELYRLWFESFMMFESYICIWMTSIKSPRAISYIEVSSVLEDKEHCIIVFSQFELTLYYLLFYFLIYKICFLAILGTISDFVGDLFISNKKIYQFLVFYFIVILLSPCKLRKSTRG